MSTTDPSPSKIMFETNQYLSDYESESNSQHDATSEIRAHEPEHNHCNRSSKDRRDIDVIREHSRFLWSDGDEPRSWSERLAKRYWDKLFKEYCLVDLSRFKENKFGMRWRLERDVICGKGQFTCGNVHCSTGSGGHLRSWEVNFAYKELGERRNALVKLRLCPECSSKLNYRYKRRDVTGKTVTAADQSATTSNVAADGDTDTETPDTKRSKVTSTTESTVDAETAWRNSAQPGNTRSHVPKTQDEEFDDYFSDMLL